MGKKSMGEAEGKECVKYVRESHMLVMLYVNIAFTVYKTYVESKYM